MRAPAAGFSSGYYLSHRQNLPCYTFMRCNFALPPTGHYFACCIQGRLIDVLLDTPPEPRIKPNIEPTDLLKPTRISSVDRIIEHVPIRIVIPRVEPD